MKLSIFLIAISVLLSCTPKDTREGTHTADGDYVTFSDSTTGWTARYPKSWKALTAKEIATMEGKGEELLEEVADGELIITHRNLLWLKKDDFNSMTSNYQPYNPDTDGPYDEMETVVTDVLESAYTQRGIAFESTTRITMIDGLAFSTWEGTIFTSDHSDTLMTQIMYQRLIKEHTALLININYGNKAGRDTLMAIVNSSKFKFRD